MLVLDKSTAPPSKGACVFLVELAGGQARCGAYSYRPSACRTFPAMLRHGTAAIRPNIVCGASARSVATMDLPAFRRDLTTQSVAWAEQARIASAWNASVEAGHSRRAGAERLSFLLTARDPGGDA